jgi:TetR/AcrR family transcriptional regulator, tetracycline repressor protein
VVLLGVCVTCSSRKRLIAVICSSQLERCSGYGSGVQLHKADVVDAATALLDSYGIADLTMRRLARELDVSPGALYWHFPNKQALLGAVADRILQPARGQLAAAGWRGQVTEIGGRLRDALLSHTDGAELASASFAAGQSAAMADIVARLAAAATEAGVPSEQAELAARTVVYYVLGFTADEQSRLQWDAAGAALADGQSALTTDPTSRFAFGLRLLVDGMARVPRSTRALRSASSDHANVDVDDIRDWRAPPVLER